MVYINNILYLSIISLFLFRNFSVKLSLMLAISIILSSIVLYLLNKASLSKGASKLFSQDSIFKSSVGFLIALVLISLIHIAYNESLNNNTLFFIVAIVVGIVSNMVAYSYNKSDNTKIEESTMNLEPRVLGQKPIKNMNGTDKVIPKVLDTSIIIDGRLLKIAQSQFLEGPFIVPNFVIREIQLISDASDPIKRARGREGLNMLEELQKNKKLGFTISYKDYTEVGEVDAKLIKMCKDKKAKLITNDFNLNKVASLQGIQILNINDLANAMKPLILQGQEMEIQVIKEGKDQDQGVGYLNDGTMVIIENGRNALNKKVKVMVTNIIQTAAGKTIFAKIT